jgi:hypothetical protein
MDRQVKSTSKTCNCLLARLSMLNYSENTINRPTTKHYITQWKREILTLQILHINNQPCDMYEAKIYNSRPAQCIEGSRHQSTVPTLAHVQLGRKRGELWWIKGSERDRQATRRIEGWIDEHNLNTGIN